MFLIFQLLMVAVLIAGTILFFGKIKRKEKSIVAGLIVCLLLSAWIANGILNLVPLPTDEVIVTATGEKNKDAQNNEIYIMNYVIGGEKSSVKNPTEGKWFWKGYYYMWRNESDPRQPEGTTRSITLNIPYGRDRLIRFGRGELNGIVEVTYNGESRQYDLFQPGDEATFFAPVPDTDSFALYSVKLLRLGLFFLITLVLMAFPVFCAVKYGYETIKKFWIKHGDKLFYACIALGCFWVMFESGKASSLWLDEVWSIAWFYDGGRKDGYFKLFVMLYTFWFKLMPYGQEYLLIISELFVAATVYILGMIGRLYRDKRLGIFMATIGATSVTIMAQCGTELRPYALLLLAVTSAAYLFAFKQINLPRISTVILVIYSIVLVVCMDSHEFGLLTAGFLMLFDFFLIIKRKMPLNGLVEFVLPAIYGLQWLFTRFLADLSNADNYKIVKTPDIKRVISTIIWLCGANSGKIMLILLILGYVIGLAKVMGSIKGKHFDFKNDYIILTFLSIPCLVILFNWFYSVILNPGNPLWVNRYFVPVIPFFVFFMALALDTILSFLIANKADDHQNKNYFAIFTTATVICFCIIGWYKMPYETNPVNDYKGAAEYIMSEDGAYSPNTLCYVSNHPDVNKGFEYYLTQKGKRDPINHISNLLEYTEDDLKPYDTVYVVAYKNSANGEDLLRDSGFEETYSKDDEDFHVRKWERIS